MEYGYVDSDDNDPEIKAKLDKLRIKYKPNKYSLVNSPDKDSARKKIKEKKNGENEYTGNP